LSTNNIDVAKDAGSANAMIILHNESMGNRVLSVDGSGQAREYQLSYTVNFSIVMKGQQSIQDGSWPVSDKSVADEGAAESEEDKQQLKVDSLTLNRTLLFQQDAVLAVANESEILYQDMRRNAARMILLRLQARSQQKEVKQTEAGQSLAPSSAMDTGAARENSN